MPARREAVLLQLGQKAMAQEEARRFFNGIRSFWVGSAAPTEETVARWVLQAHPIFFFSSRRRHTSSLCDWSSDVCSSDLCVMAVQVDGRTAAPSPPASLSGEGLEGGLPRLLIAALRIFPSFDRLESMKPVVCRLLFCLACALTALPLAAQEGPLENTPPKDTTPEEIIKRFAAKETEFSKAREQYTYRQDVKVQTVDGETVDGEYHEVFDVIFDPKGKRSENVIFAPQSSLTKIAMSQEDFEDIRHRLPFVLTAEEVGEYNILYVGQQQEDELHCFVFDIAPKQIEGKKRYFQGRVWVDDHDLQIVKTYGKTVPDIT